MLLLTLLMSSSALVELYTSEGCSSCPPADAMLQSVAKGPVLGLSLHVDYWNDLGWSDPYSSADATARQQEYARVAQQRTYTPQVMIDGRYVCVGSDRECIDRALAKAGDKTALKLACSKDKTTVSSAALPAGRLTIAWLTRQATTTVTRGENKGKTLTHAWVTRKLQTQADWQGAAVSLPAHPAGDRVVAFVQNRALEVTALGSCDL